MNRAIITILSFLLLIGCRHHDQSGYYIDGVADPVIDLNGIWKVNINPPETFRDLEILDDDWKDIQVPGECMMQGFPVKHDKPFVYKKSIPIPEDFNGKTIIIQFDGVYSYTRIWVNGNFAGDHSGGFTRWDCDITPFVKPGETAMLTAEVTDKADEISYGSGYAKHPIGGILRSVRLMALPVNYPLDITIITDFDEHFEHASLKVTGRTKYISENAEITFELYDKNNRKIRLANSKVEVINAQAFTISNQINSPQKWDAEHPILYDLNISFYTDNALLWEKSYKIGFREITLKGNKLLVNGREVKLRGACHHDIHPMLGRVSTPEYELRDVLLAKEGNMNFIRTSHYPPSDNFLSLCDAYGLYIEDETAVCFVGTHRTKEYRPGATENDTSYASLYLSQLKEMVTSHKNHPSVIMWSIGNENSFGSNFKKSYDWVKENDDTRPVIFSYPGNVPDSIKAYDILSMHYPGITGNMNQVGKVTEGFGYAIMPVLFDEWAHVACYNNFTVMEDPNIRDFWGRGLDTMWQRVFEADGGLGGAIWGMIDETFMLPDTLTGFNEWWGIIDQNVIPAEYSGKTIGYGEWGIVDAWRRKKPEFWNTKKAYSPVKILKTRFDGFSSENPIIVPLYNRFDHTNINELVIKQTYQGAKSNLDPPNIDPHSKGNLEIPMKKWDPAEPVILEFYNRENNLVDQYELRLNNDNKVTDTLESERSIQTEENENELVIICGNNTKVIFDKKTGLIKKIQDPAGFFLISGPYVNLRTKGKPVNFSYSGINEYCKNWQLKYFEYEISGKSVILTIQGTYDNLPFVEFKILVLLNAEIRLEYQIGNVPREYVREAGVRFEFENSIDSISWERNGYWSYYPGNHLSAQKGTAALYAQVQKTYREDPGKGWNEDSKSFYYNGTENEKAQNQLTFKAKATKENICSYRLYENGKPIFSVQGDGNISCRIAKRNNNIHLFINNEMDYVDLGWGNFQRNIILEKIYSNKVLFKINTHSDTLKITREVKH